jgi:hypothetical protein
MTILQRILSICALLMLAACGGGGGDPGTPAFGGGGTGGGGGTTPVPAAADLVLVLSSSTISNNGLESVVATVTAVDTNRNSVASVPVTVSVNSNAIATPSGTTTDAQGRLTSSIGIGADTSLRTITVTAVSGSITRTAALQVQAGTGAAGQASLALASSGSIVTASAPATITATLRNAQNAPIAGRVVLLSSVRGLSTLSATSALTNADGIATITVRPAAGGLSGADEIQATSTVAAASGANTTLTSSVGISVTGATPTISVALSPAATTLRTSTSPVDFTATVRNELGEPVANQLVTFRAAGNLVALTPATVLTDAAGRALTRIAPVSAATNGAEVLSASTSLSGRDLQSSVNLQLVAEIPSVALTLSNSNVSNAAPATARATVLNAAGAPVAGTVVTFSSQFNLGAFNPATASTNADGVATPTVAPRTPTSSGADVISAAATVAGVTRNASAAAQFTGAVTGGTPVLELALSATSISSASPATVTATLRDAAGSPVSGQVVGFNVVRELATTNAPTALTDSSGRAIVVLSPATANTSGADEITASANFSGAALSATRGFQIQATPVTLGELTALSNTVSAYGQTTLNLAVTGASAASPVNITLASTCVSQGKATLSPANLSVTGANTTIQYRDNGCGAVLPAGQQDRVTAVVTATGASTTLNLTVQPPADASIAFVTAAPEQIFLRGSGFTESSVVTFEVRDAAGNPLPNRVVELRLQTGAGGVTMEGRGVESVSPPSADPYTQQSNADGRVAVRVNSGTLPTPVRINARLRDNTSIATVSSNLSVAVGLPSQLNFSLSQGTRNIEGYNIDGTPNTYQIIAADRSGNPVPAGTSINFVTEGGQIEAIKQTQLVNGIARTTANFVSSEPRPIDGRVTITVYALGEESFVDLNGNNVFDTGEPFQDLGNIFQDRNYNGSFQSASEEFIPLVVNNANACAAIGSNLLLLDASIPSAPGTCSGSWSGAGQVYVRRAVETVLSTSAARPLWASTAGLASTCSARAFDMQIGPETTQTGRFVAVGGDTWYAGSGGSTLPLIVADANPGRDSTGQLPRLNPMAAGTTITATTPTTGLTVQVGGGSPVPSTTSATGAAIAFNFTDPLVTSGVIFVTFVSPSGVGTTVTVPVTAGARPSTCSP